VIARATLATLVVREAVAQLFEYRHFLGPKDAKLCIALGAEPTADIIPYVEDVLQMFIVWASGDVVYGGPRTAAALGSLGLRVASEGELHSASAK
jgi:hypothetical protein